MALRDPHAILLNRSSILVVTSVGVGVLTLAFVLGVQVGKQSAALQKPASKGSGENLQALPTPILDQLKSFDAIEGDASPKPEPKQDAKASAKADSKLIPKPVSTAQSPVPKWTLQLVSTPDKTEAERVASRAKAAGYAAQVVKEGGEYKVRWNHAGPKAGVDTEALKLKAAGFRPFAVPVE